MCKSICKTAFVFFIWPLSLIVKHHSEEELLLLLQTVTIKASTEHLAFVKKFLQTPELLKMLTASCECVAGHFFETRPIHSTPEAESYHMGGECVGEKWWLFQLFSWITAPYPLWILLYVWHAVTPVGQIISSWITDVCVIQSLITAISFHIKRHTYQNHLLSYFIAILHFSIIVPSAESSRLIVYFEKTLSYISIWV